MYNTDPKIPQAATAIKALLEDERRRPRKRVYYIGQLQVLLEDSFFPWLIYNAAVQLCRSGYLKRQIAKTTHADKVTFLFHHHFGTSQMRTRIATTTSLIDKYSRPRVAKILSLHLEALVKAELRAQGFDIVGEHTNQYKGNRWTKTDHNLDFIAEHRSGRLAIGVEVKNTLSVPERDEIQTKLDLCRYLNLTAVFATRWMKPYVQLIRERGGFSWFFKTQIYPLDYEKFTQIIWNKLGLPVTVRTELPPKSVAIFSEWVRKSTVTNREIR